MIQCILEHFYAVNLTLVLSTFETGSSPFVLFMKLRSRCYFILHRETSSIKVNDIASRIANNVGAAVEATNSLLAGGCKALTFHYNRQNSKRRRLLEPISGDPSAATMSEISGSPLGAKIFDAQGTISEGERNIELGGNISVSADSDEGSVSLSKMVSVLCEQHLFLPLLRAFEMFLPSCSLVPFIRALQVCKRVQHNFLLLIHFLHIAKLFSIYVVGV